MSLNKPESFSSLLNRAEQRKGGKKALSFLLGTNEFYDHDIEYDISLYSDDRILAAFTKQIFKSGFVWHP